jgi:hypothetical protein
MSQLKILFALLVTFIALSLFTPVDDSDVSMWDRSGFTVTKDAATGCEYFSKLFGGITPRLNADGSHRGCRKN